MRMEGTQLLPRSNCSASAHRRDGNDDLALLPHPKSLEMSWARLVRGGLCTREDRRSILPLSLTRLSLFMLSLAAVAAFRPAFADVNDLRSGQWSGGGGVGFLGNTPDGVAEFAFKGHADYFFTRNVSVGPLAQYAGAGNDFLFGLSAQAKYWWDIPGSRHAAKVAFQGGIGFVRAGIKDTDSGTANTYTSFLIPLGVSFDYALGKQLAVIADLLLNVTSLGETVRSGGRDFDLHTNVMPGVYFGVRF